MRLSVLDQSPIISGHDASRAIAETLAKQYVIRDRGRVDLGVPPGWLLVLPVEA